MDERVKQTIIFTDVLVIGGGMAGWFAADKAAAQGASVLLVDKGYVGKAGQTPVAAGTIVFNQEWGDNLDEWIEISSKAGEYLQNRDWAETMLLNSYDRYLDLSSWGIEFEKNEDGTLNRPAGDDEIIRLGTGMLYSARTDHSFQETFGYKARKHLESIGVNIIDRLMICEYIQDVNGRVVGAVGIPMGKNEVYVIQAGAVVSCAGASSYKPSGSGCLCSITGDGDAMAYRAGAALGGKEFVQPMYFDVISPGKFGRRGIRPEMKSIFREQPFGSGANNKKTWYYYDGTHFHEQEGKLTHYIFAYLDLDLETHAARGPIYAHCEDGNRQMVSGSALGMALRHSDGIFPADMQCRSSIPGLYAAGDSLNTMIDGAIYRLRGGCLAGAAVTGAIAGECAAEEALSLADSRTPLNPAAINRVADVVCAPLNCNGGYSPRWVSQLLTNVMSPYFVGSIKKGDRLEAALTYVEFMQEHLVPKLIARDPHELRLAHEAKNMVLSAEIRLRSSLFRTESRGMHYREDYPMRDDENWLCWTKLRKNGEKMEFEKVPIPDEWKPDLSIPYRERYPYRFPGEEDKLG